MPQLRHILFPVDLSPQMNTAVPYVAALARRFDARVTLLCVVPPIWAGRGPQPEYARELEISTRSRLEGILAEELDGLRVERVVRSGEAASEILSFSHENGVDLIMMATHGHRALMGALAGSVAAKVLHEASCPVWMAAHAAEANPRKIPQRIICCVEGTPQSIDQIRWTVAFAGLFRAAVRLLHVTPPVSDVSLLLDESELQEQQRRVAETRMEALRREALEEAAADVPLTVVAGSIAGRVAARAGEEEADLVVIGHGRMRETLGRLRTEAYSIIRQSPCPVISI